MSDANTILGWWMRHPSEALTSTLTVDHFASARDRRLASVMLRHGWTHADLQAACGAAYVDTLDELDKAARYADEAAVSRSTDRLHQDFARKAAEASAVAFLGRLRGKGAAPIQTLIQEHVRGLAEAEAMAPAKGRLHGEVAAEVMAEWLRTISEPDASATMPMPWSEIDAHTGGWVIGKLHLVGGRSSEHKTTWARCCAAHLASLGIPTAYWTAEDSDRDIAGRTLAADSDLLDTRALMLGRGPRGRNPTQGDLERVLADAQKSIEGEVGRKLRIVDVPNPPISTVLASIKTLAANGVRAVFFDFIQLIRPDRGEPSNEWWRGTIASLAGLAKQLQIVIVCTSQIEKTGTQASVADGRVPRADEMPFGAVMRQGAFACIMVGATVSEKTGNKLLLVEVDKWKSAESVSSSMERGTFFFSVDASHDRLTEIKRGKKK